MKKNRIFPLLIVFVLLLLSACGNSNAESADAKKTVVTDLILATTTSTQDSGLLDVLLPLFEEENNVKVKTIAVGTGQALEMGKKGEADILLVHAPKSEEELVNSGDVINRKRVMYNDFILVGPSDHPAEVSDGDIKAAFQKILEGKANFVTRGDDSGTHKKELGIWASINVQPVGDSYISTGQGMGASLQVANEKNAYILTDRATWLAQEKNVTNLKIVVEGAEDLMNIYHVMQVNPEKHDMVNHTDAEKFIEFMINNKTQAAIEDFGKDDYGQSLFFKYTE
ncbi:substrate-binding domain-containing protein [Bacillus sp. MRMR6]|uniref:substrate-binding domain-containing protein n=1 Tax=Bacillus sp. MRMR6 TaxID=1928617 RepID=UPI0009510C16|nr:substrate-binding domain-containing protein [Bacillus sp. MRMR6]OLS35293.1 tungsten ABC transporter substrate-binding protein [Bacillus sp. MRMR6]